jgi:hypothetical protein
MRDGHRLESSHRHTAEARIIAGGAAMEREARGVEPTRTTDEWIGQLVAGQTPEAAALALAELSSRVVAELHRRARAEAQARRGQPEWGRWAKLANAARGTVLQAASCRDVARELKANTPEP